MKMITELYSFSPAGKFKRILTLPCPDDLDLMYTIPSNDGQLLLLSRLVSPEGQRARLQKVTRNGRILWTRDFLDGYWTTCGKMLIDQDHLIISFYVSKKIDGKPFAAIALVTTDLDGNLLDTSWEESPKYEREPSVPSQSEIAQNP